MRGEAKQAAVQALCLSASDEFVAFAHLGVVFDIHRRVRHVVVLSDDGGLLIGDSSLVDIAVTCTRCSTYGHRSDTCTVPGVRPSPRILRRLKHQREKEAQAA